MTILEREFYKEIDVSIGVVKWNYWDGEHLTVVHKNYTDCKSLYEKPGLLVSLVTYKLPIFSFLRSNAMSTAIHETKDDREIIYNFNVGLFGIPSVTTITLREKGPNACHITMNYKFFLRGWRLLLKPLMNRMMASWNEQVWVEDLPLKYRRHKVLRHGFQDFVGMPASVRDRQFSGDITCDLPIRRPSDSPMDTERIN